ncbi:hypothetical protein HK102_008107, partial [Quaeritorhiza haematococci]
LARLVMFNIVSTFMSGLSTWVLAFQPVDLLLIIIFWEGPFAIAMQNSYLRLVLSRAKAFSTTRVSSIWDWVANLQIVVIFIDILLFILVFRGILPPIVFTKSGSICFGLVIALETAVEIVFIWSLIQQRRCNTDSRTIRFVTEALIVDLILIFIDISLIVTNIYVQATVFIVFKRLEFAIKTRMSMFMFNEGKTMYLKKPEVSYGKGAQASDSGSNKTTLKRSGPLTAAASKIDATSKMEPGTDSVA